MADKVLVVLFLRGGADGLSLIAPTADADYAAARPESLRVLRKGNSPGHLLGDQLADVDFRFHPAARGLAELFGAGELAVIHAAGLADGTRSHFEAEDRMERAADRLGSGGWIGRWLATTRPEGILPAFAVGSSAPEAMRGSAEVAVADQIEGLILAGDPAGASVLQARLRAGFGAHPLLAAPLERLLSLSQTLERRLFDPATGGLGAYVPAVDYPGEGDLSRSLMTVAQAIKLDLGLRVATVDFGGWDTHDGQADIFAALTGALSGALSAFWRDLGSRGADVTLVVVSEFGRRLRANNNGGTDHGHGNAMLVLGGAIRGGRMLGRWPGLANELLDDGADLAITTDYRHVLAEVMARHMNCNDLSVPFPDFTPSPLGLYL